MSNWTDVRDQLIKLGLPLLGAALPVPGGAAIGIALASAIGSSSSSPSDVINILTHNEDALQKAKEFESTHQETMLKLAIDAEQKASEEVTDRWKADMSSDSLLAKNIRPMVLIYLLSLYAVFALASGFGFKVTESYVSLLGQWGMVVMSAYFVGRSAEKIKSMMN